MTNFFKTAKNAIKYWWVPLLTGLIFIAVGIYTFVSPLESYVALSVLFSITFIVSGIFETIFSISNRDEMDNWGWSLVFGLFSLVMGILLIMNPEVSLATLPFYVGFLVMFRSIAGISYAIDLKNYGILDWGNLMMVAVLGFILSFILLWNPLLAGFTIVFWTGSALVVAGGYAIYLSVKLKKIKSTPKKLSKELKKKWEEVNKEMQEELRVSK